jgi:tetratricopeptide (TPR) repeat protein
MANERGPEPFGSRPAGRRFAALIAGAKGLAGKAALSTARMWIQRGHGLLDENKPDEALEVLDTAVRITEYFVPPDERDTADRLRACATSWLGQAAAAIGAHERAREAFSTAVTTLGQVQDLTWEEYSAYAVALHGIGRVSDAIDEQRAALRHGDESTGALLRLARWLREEGRLNEAEQELRRFKPQFPADPDVALVLAEVLDDLGSPNAGRALVDAGIELIGADRATEALDVLNRASVRLQDSAEVASWRAIVLAGIGQADQALDEFDRAIILGGNEADLRLGKAITFASIGRYQDALVEIDLLGGDAAQTPAAAAIRGYTLSLAGDHKAAAEELGRAFAKHPAQPQVAMLLGEELLQLGRYPEALDVLDKAIELTPNDPLAHARRGQVLLEENELKAAIEELRRAVALDPSQPWMHAQLGEALQRDEQFDEALKHLEQCLQLAPDNAWALGTRGQVFATLGRLQAAAADLRRAVDLDPSLIWSFAELGRVLLRLRKHGDALAALDQALAIQKRATRQGSATRLDPRRHAEVLQTKADVLQNLGDHAGAAKALRAAIALARDHAGLHAELAENLRLLGRYKEALTSANRAIKLEPTLANAWGTKGAALAAIGGRRRRDEAVKAVERAMSLGKGDASTMTTLADIRMKEGNLQEAERLFRAATEAQQDYLPAQRGLGDTLRRQGRYDDAYASLELALALSPEDVQTHRILGYTLLRADRFDDALVTFQRALELSPADAVVAGDIVRVLMLKEDFEGALKEAQDTVEKHPDSLAAKITLGCVLCYVGDFEEATDLLRPVARDAPDNDEVGFWLGWALQNRGRRYLKEALSVFQRIVAIEPDPWYRKELANVMRSLRDSAAHDEYGQVLDAFDALSSNPTDLAVIGWCRYGRNEFSEAVDLYRRSLRIAPSEVDVRFDLALGLLCEGRGELAQDQYGRSLEQLQRRSRMRQRGLLRVALVDLQEARRLLPLDGDAKACEEMLRDALTRLDRDRMKLAAAGRSSKAKTRSVGTVRA